MLSPCLIYIVKPTKSYRLIGDAVTTLQPQKKTQRYCRQICKYFLVLKVPENSQNFCRKCLSSKFLGILQFIWEIFTTNCTELLVFHFYSTSSGSCQWHNSNWRFFGFELQLHSSSLGAGYAGVPCLPHLPDIQDHAFWGWLWVGKHQVEQPILFLISLLE